MQFLVAIHGNHLGQTPLRFQYLNFQIGLWIWTYGLITSRFRVYIYIYILDLGFRLWGVGFEAGAFNVFRVKPFKRRGSVYCYDGKKDEQ